MFTAYGITTTIPTISGWEAEQGTQHGELGRLFQQRGSFRADYVRFGRTLADLDHRRLRDYFGHIRQQSLPPD